MEWRDQGVLLAVRGHGEASAILDVLTAAHGRHAGVVPGGGSRRLRPVLQPGAQLDLRWRARLEEQIGTFAVEPLGARAPGVLGDRRALAALSAVCALLAYALPEREPQPVLYTPSVALLDGLGAPGWPLAYLRWELALLEELGFGPDLGACAVTGSRTDVAFVSPKTGRAVSRSAAGAWQDRLLVLPACLLGEGGTSDPEIAAGLRLTGHFLERWLAPALGSRPVPEARRRLVALFGSPAPPMPDRMPRGRV